MEKNMEPKILGHIGSGFGGNGQEDGNYYNELNRYYYKDPFLISSEPKVSTMRGEL